jgi:hypothetical protein
VRGRELPSVLLLSVEVVRDFGINLIIIRVREEEER